MVAAKVRLGAFVAAWIAGLVMVTAPAASAHSARVVRYAVDLNALPNAMIVHIQGAKTADGACSFKEDVKGQATGRPTVTVVRTLSINADTCKREAARAIYPADRVPPAVAALLNDAPDSKSVESRRENPKSNGATPAADWHGYLRLFLEDPIWIDVNTTLSELTWNATSSYHRSHWDWLGLSGWYQSGSWHNHAHYGSWAETITVGLYENYSWGDDALLTFADHRYNYFLGDPYGGWAWGYEIIWGGEDHTWLAPDYAALTP